MAFKDYPIQALMDVTARPSLVFVKGKGSWLWDNTGKKYLDFVQGWAVNCLGHCPDIIAETLNDQALKLITPSPSFYNEPALRLAERIVHSSCFQRVFFTNSGAEANEGAIKLARKWGSIHKNGAYEIITFENSFHGRTLATMSASGKPQFKDLFEPKVPGFPKAVLNEMASVERLVSDKTVAVMVEPIQGEAGVVPAEDTFLRELRQFTKDRGLLLIVDEIQTGVGRTGTIWGYQHSGIEPDIMTLGKMLGGGVPLAAMASTEQASCFSHGDQGGTFNGNPLMTAVGNAILDTVLKPGFLDHVKTVGSYLMDRLSYLSTRHDLGTSRGKGLLVALDLKRDMAQELSDRARDHGLLINAPRPGLLRFMPSLDVSEQEIDAMIDILDELLGDMLR